MRSFRRYPRHFELVEDVERCPLICGSTTPSYYAWCGDALQKLDIRTRLGFVDGQFEVDHTKNESQKAMLSKLEPEIYEEMVRQGRSVHSFGTVFEELYYTKKQFRSKALKLIFTSTY